MLDVRLTSVDSAPRPATSLKRLWESDKVTIPQLEHCSTTIAETDRPT
jgi:hypothetical protein